MVYEEWLDGIVGDKTSWLNLKKASIDRLPGTQRQRLRAWRAGAGFLGKCRNHNSEALLFHTVFR
jgi:hypothetical protein